VSTASPGGKQSSWNHPAVVEDEKIAGLKKLGKIAEKVIPVFARLPIENEHTARTPHRRRRLGNKLFRQIEMKISYSHCLILVCEAGLCFSGLGEFDRMIESRLNSDLLSGSLRRPGDGNARKRLGNEEPVPGSEFPGLIGVDIEGADGAIDEFGELCNTRLCDLRRTTRTIRSDSAIVTGKIGSLEIAEAAGAVTGAGASNGNETETLYGASDEFAVEAATD
jgi:hypothetical protein